MDDEPLLSPRLGDPLRRIDVCFEPYDPVFDADEEPRVRIGKRKPRRIGAATALGIVLGCGEGRPAPQIPESTLVQPAPPSDADEDGRSQDADVAPDLWAAPDETSANHEGDDADSSSP